MVLFSSLAMKKAFLSLMKKCVGEKPRLVLFANVVALRFQEAFGHRFCTLNALPEKEKRYESREVEIMIEDATTMK